MSGLHLICEARESHVFFPAAFAQACPLGSDTPDCIVYPLLEPGNELKVVATNCECDLLTCGKASSLKDKVTPHLLSQADIWEHRNI